jgi:diguanylate cyclase (GGDEF)-like protein/PAS domain S-box-containing protein
MAKREDFSNNVLGEFVSSLAGADSDYYDADRLIDSIMEAFQRYFVHLSVAIVVEDPRWNVVRVVRSVGPAAVLFDEALGGTPPRYWESIRQLALGRRFDELPSTILPGTIDASLDERYRCLVVPLSSMKDSRGALIALYEGTHLNSDAPEWAALQYVEHDLVIAIERQVSERLRERLNRQTSVTRRLTHRLTDTSLDNSDWIGVVFEGLIEVFEASVVRLALNNGAIPLEYEATKDALGLYVRRRPSGRGTANYVTSTGQPVISAFVRYGLVDPIDALAHARTRQRSQSYLAVPLREDESEVIGVIAVLDRAPYRFNDDDLAFLTQIAETLAAGITYRAAIRQSLRDARENASFAKALEQAADAVIVVGPAQAATYANDAAERLFGYSAEELMSFPSETLVREPERHILRSKEVLDKLFTREVITLDLPCARKDGSTFIGGFTIVGQFDERNLPTGWIANIRDHTERVNREANLRYEADIDPLTSTLNRRAFVAHLRDAIGALDGSDYLAVAYVDLNGFKAVNDTYGHAAGDELLRLIAQRLSSGIKAGDVLSRFGGDEFLVLLRHLRSPRDAQVITNRLAERIGGSGITVGRDQILVTASFGLSVTRSNATDAERLIQRADQAMYRTKGQGGIGAAKGALRSSPASDLSLAEDIQRLILARNTTEFSFRFQTYRKVNDDTPYCTRAVVTWTHPIRGDLSESEFREPARLARLSDRLDLLILAAFGGAVAKRAAAERLAPRLMIDVAAESLVRPGFLRAYRRSVESIVRDEAEELVLGIRSQLPSWLSYPKLHDAMNQLVDDGRTSCALVDPEMLSKLASQPVRFPVRYVFIPFSSYTEIPDDLTAEVLDAQVRLARTLDAAVCVGGAGPHYDDILRHTLVTARSLR